jgi:hypothetical protein
MSARPTAQARRRRRRLAADWHPTPPPSSPQEVRRIKGSRSGSIQPLLGYEAGGEVVHRENLALLTGSKGGREAGEQGHGSSGEDSPGAA